MYTLIFILLFGALTQSLAQNKSLVVTQKKVDISIPFYEIENMSCTQFNEARIVEKRTDASGSYFSLNTHDYFSILDGEIAKVSTKRNDLLERFSIHVYEQKNPRHLQTTNFKIFLKEKNWSEKEEQIRKSIEKELQQQFPSYKLGLIFYMSSHQAQSTLKVVVSSSTGGNEFETTETQRQRFEDMSKAINSVLDKLIEKHITSYISKIRKDIVLPYQKRIEEKRNPRKLHTMTFDIEQLGKYNADKGRFDDVVCKDGWHLQYLGTPINQARLLRANPTQYQIIGYVFEENMSHPWSPNKDPSAFGFYEIVHKETKKLITRTFARFSTSSRQAHYRYTLNFPTL